MVLVETDVLYVVIGIMGAFMIFCTGAVIFLLLEYRRLKYSMQDTVIGKYGGVLEIEDGNGGARGAQSSDKETARNRPTMQKLRKLGPPADSLPRTVESRELKEGETALERTQRLFAKAVIPTE